MYRQPVPAARSTNPCLCRNTRGANPRRLRSRSPFGAGRRSGGAFIAALFHQSPALGGPGSREEGTSVLICKEEGTSMHHLSTMPELLQPPLSLRVPCPEGIRQRRPRRERVCDDLRKLQFRWSGLNCCPGRPQRVSLGGAPDSPKQAIGLITIARVRIYMATQPPYMGSQGLLLYTHINL